MTHFTTRLASRPSGRPLPRPAPCSVRAKPSSHHWRVPACVSLLILVAVPAGYAEEPAQEAPRSSRVEPGDGSPDQGGAFPLTGATDHGQSTTSPFAELPEPDRTLPTWLDHDAPFDLDKYFGAPAVEDNAAPEYLDAFLEFTDDVGIWFPDAADQTRAAVAHVRDDWRVSLIIQLEEMPEAIGQTQLEIFLEQFSSGLEKLRQAQQHRQCVFATEIDSLGIAPHAAAAIAATDVFRLRAHDHLVRGRADTAIEDIQTLLRLARDLRPRGSDLCQGASLRIQQTCMEFMVYPLVASGRLTAEQCGRLLQILVDHEQAQKVDAVVEAARFEYVILSKIIRQLERGSYRPSRIATKMFPPQASTASILVTDLCELNAYRVNSELVWEFFKQLAQDDEKAASQLEEFEKRKDVDKRQLDRILASLLLFREMMVMSAADYRREIELLGRRYQQIEGVAALPLPQQSAAYEPLEESWTDDDMWRETKLLRIFAPTPGRITAARCRTVAGLRLSMALVALARWQLSGHELTDDLSRMLNAGGLADVPVDPFSGEAIKMRRYDQRLVLYTFGPDRDDDRGERETDGRASDTIPDGDYCLELPLRRSRP